MIYNNSQTSWIQILFRKFFWEKYSLKCSNFIVVRLGHFIQSSSLKPTALSEKRVLKQPCPTGGNGGIVSHQLPARWLPPANVSSAALQIALRISKVAGWVRLASVAGGQRTWTQPCFARLSRVPARTVSRDSWLEYIGAHYLPVEIFLIWTFAFRAIFIYVLYTR